MSTIRWLFYIHLNKDSKYILDQRMKLSTWGYVVQVSTTIISCKPLCMVNYHNVSVVQYVICKFG